LTDDRSACIIVNGHAHVVLLSEPFFQTHSRSVRYATRSPKRKVWSHAPVEAGRK
jgi:predicted lactoylglutathione lyase